MHFRKIGRQDGNRLDAAAVIGRTAAVGLCSVAKVPCSVDEYTAAGGIAGER
jgi:UbiD family decarboxylase